MYGCVPSFTRRLVKKKNRNAMFLEIANGRGYNQLIFSKPFCFWVVWVAAGV
jgi:hypothetical protein